MPQLDKFTYFTQFFWSCLFLFTFYIAICNDGDGLLGISRILKLRNQLLSHRTNNIRSKDPNSLEDILRKGFSTGLSYMYSSLFEVSQWCKAVDLLGKRRKITLISCFGEISGSRGMEKNIFVSFSAIAFSTFIAIMTEQKLYRWFFLLSNYLVREFRLDLHHDIFFFLILILVFVSWILVRTLFHLYYKYNKCRNSGVPKIEKTFSISMCVFFFYMYLAGFVQIAECAPGAADPESRLGPPGTPLERGEASLPSLNELPTVMYEQQIQIPDNKFINVELCHNEMASLIDRLPKEELKDVIRENSVRKPLNEFSAEQQAQLIDLAIKHFSIKNEIIAKIKCLYPNDEWELTRVIRDKFFGGRQRDRESSLEDLQKMLSALNEKGKYASCSKRLRSCIRDWDWKE